MGTALVAVLGFALLLGVRLAGRADRVEGDHRTSPQVSTLDAPTQSHIQLTDMTATSGIDFRYRNGEEAGHLTILESLGGGVAIFDFDGDGWPDLFFNGGGRFVASESGFVVEGLPGRLYRNEGDWRFRDVTEQVGLSQSDAYTHGCAIGDYDNDGHPDLLVTSYQGVRLYRNQGGERFRDVTAEAGLDNPGWATAAAWADIDGDGFLDLYVCRYVNWSPENNPQCFYRASGQRDICSPSAFEALSDSLYRNQGDGTFEEVSRAAGLQDGGKGLGVIAADFNNDRQIDFYVANDTTPNFLYRNRGDGTFEEVGFLSGAALDAQGVATGTMGIAVGDVDNDGDLDILITNYEGETNELYRNEGDFRFTPMGATLGLAAASRPLVGWGTGLVDLDRDGRLDAFVANGHLMHHLPGTSMNQPALLFGFEPSAGRFVEVGADAGSYFQDPHQGRGCAFGDLDLDGDLDMVVVHQNRPVRLLRNDSNAQTTPSHTLRLRLEGTQSNRSAIGTTVIVEVEDRTWMRQVVGGGGYLSHDDRRLMLSLGEREQADRVEVRWPSGQTDVHIPLATEVVWLLREGEEPRPERKPATPR